MISPPSKVQIGRVDLAEQHNNEALGIEESGSDRSGILDSQLVEARIQAIRRHFVEAERLFAQSSKVQRRTNLKCGKLKPVWPKLLTKRESQFKLKKNTAKRLGQSKQQDSL